MGTTFLKKNDQFTLKNLTWPREISSTDGECEKCKQHLCPARRGCGGQHTQSPARRGWGGRHTQSPARRGCGGRHTQSPARRGCGGRDRQSPARRDWGGRDTQSPARRDWGGRDTQSPARRGSGGRHTQSPEPSCRRTPTATGRRPKHSREKKSDYGVIAILRNIDKNI